MNQGRLPSESLGACPKGRPRHQNNAWSPGVGRHPGGEDMAEGEGEGDEKSQNVKA